MRPPAQLETHQDTGEAAQRLRGELSAADAEIARIESDRDAAIRKVREGAGLVFSFSAIGIVMMASMRTESLPIAVVVALGVTFIAFTMYDYERRAKVIDRATDERLAPMHATRDRLRVEIGDRLATLAHRNEG